MLKKNNKVHLDGVLEGFELVGATDDHSFALASLVTLHARPGVSVEAPQSERYAKIHHELRIVSNSGNVDALDSFSKAFGEARSKGVPYPCSVDGHLFSDGNETYVVCGVDDLKRIDRIKTSGNNRVNITGEVVSTSHTNETATIRLKTDEGTISSFIFRRQNQSNWDMVVDGKVSKGDSLSIIGPLLSNRMTDGKKVLRFCQVSPHLIQKLNLEKSVTRKKGAFALN